MTVLPLLVALSATVQAGPDTLQTTESPVDAFACSGHGGRFPTRATGS